MILRIPDFYKLPPAFDESEQIRMIKGKLGKRISGVTDPDFVEYLSTLIIPGIILPEELIRTPKGLVYAYTMSPIPNSINIDDYIIYYPDKLSFDVVSFIKEIFRLVEEAHKHFVINDIHNENILLTSKRPYLIDCDNGVPLYTNAREETFLYRVTVDNCELESSVLSDTFKAFISAVCLYYKFDFQDQYESEKIEFLLEDLIRLKAPKGLIRYLDYLITQALKNNFWEIKSFSEFSGDLIPPSEDALKMVRERL